MRRVGLALITVFALVASGVSAAVAAQDCPMNRAAPVAASAHDCCPDGAQKPADPGQEDHESDSCTIGMPCRTAAAVTPSLAPVALPTVVLALGAPLLGEPAPPSGPLQELFRPPRTT